jgi:hypothetical protein
MCIEGKGAAYTRLVNVEDDFGLLLLRHVHDYLEHSNAIIPAQNIALRRWIGSSGYVSPLPVVLYLPLLNPVPHRSMSGKPSTPLQKVDKYSGTAAEFVRFLLHSIQDKSLIQYYSQIQRDAIERLRSTLESPSMPPLDHLQYLESPLHSVFVANICYSKRFSNPISTSPPPIPVFSIYQEGSIIDTSR